MEPLFQLWLSERNLLAHRLMVFLLVNSILFVAFVELLGRFRLSFGVASVGLLISVLALWHFSRLTWGLDNLQEKVKERSQQFLGMNEEEFNRLKIGGTRGGRKLVAIGLPLLFIVLWVMGFLALFGKM
ncbi:hypothetical protein M1N58_00140 [Dehalococcoidales bacterium]|nr:hypothetical protein [Dehalococcoidales bacterium]